MQMKLLSKAAIGLLAFVMMSAAEAGAPVWTFTPHTATTLEVPDTGKANVQYLVHNQSHKAKRLVLKSTPGVQQTTPCNLNPKGQAGDTCTLSLLITGSALPAAGISGGPNLCQANPNGSPNPNQCYQPSSADVLRITKGGAPPLPTEYTVGGSVFGLHGALVLQNNGGDTLTKTADGSFTFSTPLFSGNIYSVTVQSQPASQTCTVSNGSGTIMNANITNVVVTCSTHAHTVGGTVSGLSGSVVLQNNGGDNLTRNVNGSFTFPTQVAQGAAYSVAVLTQPSSQTCTVSNGNGTMGGSNVTNVVVTCSTNAHTVGGTVSGLTGSVELQNNGGNNLTRNANGSFTFTTPVAQGSPYAVTVLTQPSGQICTVSNGSGTMGSSNVTNVDVSCVSNATILTSSVSNLALSRNNGASPLTGNPRIITITNSGSSTAMGVAITYPEWPVGTTAISNCGDTLAAGSSCTITITPGANATTSCTTGIAPTPGTIAVNASNANPVSTNVVVLGYGCIYQEGYVYHVDDTTPATGSISGKAVSLTDQAPRYPSGVIWSSNSSGVYDGGVAIYGIAETSTTASPIPSTGQVAGQSACNGRTDGACNSTNILVYYSPPTTNPAITPSSYAAGRCSDYSVGIYHDWYLPAICEMGPASTSSGCIAGTQNIVSNLPSLLGDLNSSPDTSCGFGVNCLAGYYWSSSENSFNPQLYAWIEYFASGGGSDQQYDNKSFQLGVRCSRALTL